MPKALSNLDTAYIENVTANCLTIAEAVQLLATQLDKPVLLEILSDIHEANNRIKTHTFKQREKIRDAAHIRPRPPGHR